jgi:predicted nucleic acid-binding protein
MPEPGLKAILDSGAARRCAHALGVPLMGTFELILRARSEGVVETASRK